MSVRIVVRITLSLFKFLLISALAVFHFVAPAILFAQGAAPGVPPFSSWNSDINLGNLNILVNIPVRSKNGPIPFVYHLTENSGFPPPPSGGSFSFDSHPQFVASSLTDQSISVITHQEKCQDNSGRYTTVKQVWRFSDQVGTVHNFPGLVVDTLGCIYLTSDTAVAPDNSGYFLHANANTVSYVSDVAGNTIYSGSTFTDTNGNSITKTFLSGSSYAYTDTLGQTAITLTYGLGGAPNQYSYTDALGTSRSVQVNFTPVTQQTSFACASGPPDIGPQAEYFPTSVSMPDGSNYQISYEATPGHPGNYTGRVSSVQLPTGATISYAYQGPNNGINCSDGTAATIVKTTPDGVWTFTHTPPSSPSWISTTKVTDPLGNDTVYTFSNGVEVQRLIYQGSATGSPLSTIVTCYTSVLTGCPSAFVSLPISYRDVLTTPKGMAGYSQAITTYDTNGRATSSKLYDFGASTYAFYTVIHYGTWTGSLPCAAFSNPAIRNRVCAVTTTDASGNTKSQTLNSYDVNGNLLTSEEWVSGTSYLTKAFTYFGNGTVQTFTDTSGGLSTYAYNGAGGCNGLLPTSVTVTGSGLPPSGLTTASQWDCNGAVLTQTTDPNGNQTLFSYTANGADPYYRLKSKTDPLGYVTYDSYTTNSAESYLNFGSSSTVDLLTTVDGMGRTVRSQTRQGQGVNGFDTVTTIYNAEGLPSGLTQPCSSPAGTNCPSSPATNVSFDPLLRPTSVTDGGGGGVSISYSQNDVLQTLAFPPIGELPKSKQLQYDALGRLTSVCEILSSGGASCGQNTAASGYKTSYAYSVPTSGGSQLVVTQGTQIRTYLRDGLGRLISEANPETNNLTTSYIYDSVAANHCTGSAAYSAPGDLVAIAFPNGNHVCYHYDALHRVTDTANNNQSATNPCRRFRYDNSLGVLGAIPTGITVHNVLGNIVEAETDTCASPITQSSIITDEWFNYSTRNENTDVYESTLHSGSPYYHTTAAYGPSGALQSLSGIPGYTSISYGVDGEGRLSTAQQGTTKAVCDSICSASSTMYNSAGDPVIVNVGGTTDNDHYTYDPSTGRMQGYAFSVGSATSAGTLTWNQNGTLRVLAITDGFNSGGTQTCNFGTASGPGYDELGRLLSANCGSTWSQSYSYDQFGNITKTGSVAWACPTCYNGNNQYNSTLSSLVSYDLNGNPLNDTFNQYSWNVYGHISTIGPPTGSITCGTSGTCLTHDAFGRLVEKNVAGVYSQILYSPVGKTAIMSGQTASSAYLPLPAGATLYETGSTGSARYFWHKDWLGSTRISSSIATQTVSYDRSFGPFGETSNNFGTSAAPEFAGDTQDTIAGLYDALNREFSSSQGRWISPDPVGFESAELSAPQLWNRYSYWQNNPLVENSCGRIDPLRLFFCGANAGSLNFTTPDKSTPIIFAGRVGALSIANPSNHLLKVENRDYTIGKDPTVDFSTLRNKVEPWAVSDPHNTVPVLFDCGGPIFGGGDLCLIMPDVVKEMQKTCPACVFAKPSDWMFPAGWQDDFWKWAANLGTSPLINGQGRSEGLPALSILGPSNPSTIYGVQGLGGGNLGDPGPFGNPLYFPQCDLQCE